MASNPMQRKARNSFLLGMLIAVLVAAMLIAFLIIQLMKLKQAQNEQEKSIKKVYVLTSDIKSGGEITSDSLQQVEAYVKTIPHNYITLGDIEEGTIAKIELTSGTILTKEMIETSDSKTTDDIRLQEYNMLILPSHLEVGDYIDIRLSLPTGQDYIVISKKEVKKTSEISPTTLWLEMTESELLTMSNAIVEAYTMNGSNLYAALYVEPGIQKQSSTTYPVSKEVLALINSDPNITQVAREALWAKYNTEERNNTLLTVLNQYEAGRAQNIEGKITQQIEKQKEERQRYLETLSGE